MPQEEIYRSRVSPQAAAAMPLASPDTYGAGVAGAVGQLADNVHQTQVREFAQQRKIDADRQVADFSHKYALHRQNMDGVLAQIRNNPTSPDYAEHVKRVMDANDAAREGMLEGITEGDVRRRAEQQLDEFATSLHDNETGYAESQRVAKVVGDFQSTVSIGANRIRQGADPAHYAQELKAGLDAVDGLANVPPPVRDKLRRDLEQTYGIAFVNHLNDTNPQTALGLIEAGAFGDVLTPEQLDQAKAGSQVEIRRQEAAAAHAASVATGQYHEQVATVKAQAGQGIDVSAQIPALIAQASAAGDTSEVANLQGLARDSAFAKVWGGAPPLQREARLREINAIPGARRSADQQAELKWLQDKSGGLDGDFRADPVGFAIAHGPANAQPPVLDAANPGSFAARAQWARGSAAAYGNMGLLTRNERDAYGQALHDGRNGYFETAAQLALFGGKAARMAAREVAPSDAYLQQIVTLPEGYRRLVVDGHAARAANPKLIATDDDDVKAELTGYTAGFNKALTMVPIADRAAIENTARDISASLLKQHGGQMSGNLWSMAINMALGGVGAGKTQRGGIGNWAGKAFLVPDGRTAQEFTDRVFAHQRARPQAGPVNPDGTPANLRVAQPMAMGAGRYQFFIGDRVLTGRDGKPWEYTSP